MEYKDLPSFEKLYTTIRNTISNAWNNNNIHDAAIQKWLGNFTGAALVDCYFNDCYLNQEEALALEHRLALFLLCNFVYYNEEEVKHLMKVMVCNYLHSCFKNNNLVDDSEIDTLLKKTVFSPLGNQSESSSYMLYLFRQINDLSKNDFENKLGCENIVFVDDFSITGSQAVWYIKKYLKLHPENTKKNKYILLMVSTTEAINYIRSSVDIADVIPCIVMDDSSKAFSENSIIFQRYSPEIKQLAKKMCEYYGDNLITSKDRKDGATALGFGGGEYLMGAYYNTPNNTLPIFWSEENSWTPIFKRYDKKYTDHGTVRVGGKYV